MKTLLVGRDPGKGWSLGDLPFVGSPSGERLATWSGLSGSESLAQAFKLVNLLPVPTPAILRREGHVAALNILNAVPHRQKLVLLGNDVWQAFNGACGVKTDPKRYLFKFNRRKWRGDQLIYVAHVPHPSGLNHFWNDPANVNKATTFFTDLSRG